MGHSFFFPRWRFWAPAFTLSGRQTTSSGISRWPPESTRTGRRCRGARRVRRRNCTWGRRRAMLAAGSGGLAPTGRKGNSHIPGSEALGLSFLRGGEEFLDLLRRWHPCSARHSGRRTPTVVLWVVGRFTRLLVAVVSRRRRLSPELATKKKSVRNILPPSHEYSRAYNYGIAESISSPVSSAPGVAYGAFLAAVVARL
jgi:hypothetical protein